MALQVSAWIKQLHDKAGLIIKTPTQDYLKHLQLAIQCGRPFLLEKIGQSVDATLLPVLKQRRRLARDESTVLLGKQLRKGAESDSIAFTLSSHRRVSLASNVCGHTVISALH